MTTRNILTSGEAIGTQFSVAPANRSNDTTMLVSENVTPVGPNRALAVAAWFVDPQNVSGHASDSNAGTTSGAPLLTKAEIARRWGSWTPTLDGSVVPGASVLVTMLSADANGSDPWLADPVLLNSCNLTLTAALPAASYTGALATVTAKNTTTNTPLECTFTAGVGAIAVGLLLENTTHPSRAWVEANLGAGVFRITQPITKATGPGDFNNAGNVDTWAPGDVIVAFAPLGVCVGLFGVMAQPQVPNAFNSGAALWQLTVADFSPTLGDGNCTVTGVGPTFACECYFQTTPDVLPGEWPGFNAALRQIFNNCFLSNGVQGSSFALQGGAILLGGGSFCDNALLDLQTLWDGGNATFRDCTFNSGQSTFLASGVTIGIQGSTTLPSHVVNGQGTLDFISGAATYATNTAVQTFRQAGGLQLNGQTTGYSRVTTAGATALHKLNLTPAALDAAAGAAGFGGYAEGGGAVITNGSQP